MFFRSSRKFSPVCQLALESLLIFLCEMRWCLKSVVNDSYGLVRLVCINSLFPRQNSQKNKTTLIFKIRKKRPRQVFYIHALLAKNHSQYSSCTATSYNASGLIINPHRRGSFNLLCVLGRMPKNYRTASHFMSGSLMTRVDITF